ncbi:glycerophosphodiester phosphodiesterase [Oceanospirillum sp.]|uniref:glycerophosphodiester phosphodiesterase n=1 Tax=Oceanospirillum sp. TaxID=2021254 RepID=UPI003A9478B7
MKFFAHRGALKDGPENTLMAIDMALAAGADAIEIDVIAHQGRLLVHHDLSLERTTNGEGLLAAHSVRELRRLDAGLGQRIPFLEEVLLLVGHRAIINIELKSKGTAGLLAVLLQQKAYQPLKSGILVSSFDHVELLRFQQSCPDVALGLLLYGTVLSLSAITGPLKLTSLHLSDEFIDYGLITEAKQQGLEVYIYTINQVSQLKALQEIGVDGVFTDCSALWQDWQEINYLPMA